MNTKNLALIFLVMVSPLAYSKECVLKGTKFPDLGDQQVNILRSVGADCSSGPQSGPQGGQAARFGQKGFAILDGRGVDFLDVASESATKLVGKNIVIYGYTNYFTETDPFKAWGYRFDFKIFEGNWLDGLKMMNSSDPKIDVVIAPTPSANLSSEALSDLRKSNFRALTVAKSGKGILKIEGKIGAYANTGGLYIGATSVELLN